MHDDQNISFHEEQVREPNFFDWFLGLFKKDQKAHLENQEKKAILKEVGETQEAEKAQKTDSQTVFGGGNDRWAAPSILSTNLIKGESTLVTKWGEKNNLLLMNVLLSFMIIGFFYAGLVYWDIKSSQKNMELDNQISELIVRKNQLENETLEADKFYARVKDFKGLIDNHIYWEGFFEFFEANILPDVVLPGEFSGNTSGVYSFAAQTKDYNTMLDQLNHLRSVTGVEKVGISNVGSGESAASEDQSEDGVESLALPITFTLDITLDKNIFLKK